MTTTYPTGTTPAIQNAIRLRVIRLKARLVDHAMECAACNTNNQEKLSEQAIVESILNVNVDHI